MEKPWFIWNDTDSRTMGVSLLEYPPVTRAARWVPRATLPGRSGSLGIGEPIWLPVVRRVTMLLSPGCGMAECFAWLQGRGKLVLGNEPDRVLTAVADAALPLTPLPSGGWRGTVQFHCQPLKGQVPTEPPITAALEVEAGEDPDTELRLYNPGDVASRPVLTVCGAGNVILQLDGEDALEIAFPDEDAPTVTVDTDAQMAATAAGESYASRISGSYRALWLPKLESVITWTGDLTALSVAPRWRWL